MIDSGRRPFPGVSVAGMCDVLGGAEGGATWARLGCWWVAGAEPGDVCAREGVVYCHLEGCGRGTAGEGVLLGLPSAIILLLVQCRLP